MRAVRTCVSGVALIAATAFITTQVVSQDAASPQSGQPDMQQMEQQWKKFSEPSEHHKKLDVFIGEWDQTVKMWWYPDAEPETTTSTATYTWVMDGRFVQGRYSGQFNDQTFKGMDLIGYDNFRQQYISLWVDNMSTAFMTAHGRLSRSGDELSMRGNHDDVTTGEKDKPFKTLTRFVDDNTIVYESYSPGPDGAFFKTLEVTSTRK